MDIKWTVRKANWLQSHKEYTVRLQRQLTSQICPRFKTNNGVQGSKRSVRFHDFQALMTTQGLQLQLYASGVKRKELIAKHGLTFYDKLVFSFSLFEAAQKVLLHIKYICSIFFFLQHIKKNSALITLKNAMQFIMEKHFHYFIAANILTRLI